MAVFVFLFLSGPTAVPETEEPDEALFCGVRVTAGAVGAGWVLAVSISI